MLIDTHAHIDLEDYKDDKIEAIVARAKENGVEKIIIPGVEPAGFNRIINLIEKYDCLYGAIGIHPSEAKLYNEKVAKQIFEFAQHNKIVAIGEIGLDYYWDKTFNDTQKAVFISQIEIANKLNKPVIVHDREAHIDSFEILKTYKPIAGVIMHCFSGSFEFAQQCIKEGFYIALGGVTTFKNAKKPKEIATKIPLEYLMLETDSPYLTPQPHRGERNEPAYIKFVAEEIAALRNMNYYDIANATTQNALKFFNIEDKNV